MSDPAPLSLEIDTASSSVIPATAPHPKRTLLRPLPTPGEFLFIIDNSSLEQFTVCNQSAEFKLVFAREAHARNSALVFGGAVHEGLESFHLHEPPDVQNQKIIDFFANNPAPPDEFRTVTNALQVLKAYRQECEINPDYQDVTCEEWNEDLQKSTPIIERPFELPLTVLDIDSWIQLPDWPERKWISRLHVAYSGRIDRVASQVSPRITRIQDHKTGTIVEPEEYHLAAQPQGYVWAGQRLWPDLQITGFCLNGLQLKKNTQADITARGPRGGEPPLKLFRAYFDYTPAIISRWERNTIALVSDFIQDLLRNHFPMKTKWCKGKYGRCPYWDVCLIDSREVQKKFLASDVFKDVTWDPVAGR